MKKLNQKGFTLIELLLVIAIIGILAAVLFVSLGSQRERARVTAFKESMRSVVPAAQICADQGGDVQAAAAGGALCDPANDMNFPAIPDCDGAGPDLGLTVNTATGDAWEVESTCERSGTADCVATCDASGCEFDPPEACN